MIKFLRSLFIGPEQFEYRFVHPAIRNQWINFKTIWRNESAATFGVERIFRLFLALSSYLFPGLYIRHVSGKHGLLCRKLFVEVYVLLKFLIPLAILGLNLESRRVAQVIVLYLGLETILYILSLLFLSDIYKAPISNKRSYLMTVLNYMELSFDFAVIYKGLQLVTNLRTRTDAVYFSFVTASTLGYGDMVPTGRLGKLMVILQLLCCLILLTLVFAKVVTAFEERFGKAGKQGDRRSAETSPGQRP